MPEFTTLIVFAAACLALTASPGPDMLLIASRSASQGRWAGFASLAGIQAGTYCHALAAALGLSQLFVAVPMAYDAVRYAGAAYLLFLAWQMLRSNGITPTPTDGALPYSPAVMFRQGLLTNLLNPKMALFVLALFPQFVKPEVGSVVAQVMILATVLNIIGLAVNGVVILGASKLGAAFARHHKYHRVPKILLGTVFASLAIRLAFDERR
jgi:threonine/homoserine/homoserine lactone efflux protein